MIPLEETPDTRRVGKRQFLLCSDFLWKWLLSGHTLMVREGFFCDGASIPRACDLLVSPTDLSEAAWLIHDFLYRSGGRFVCHHCGDVIQLTREEVDSLFHKINLRHEVTPRRAWYAHKGVRLGGWRSFRR
jgi:hypothetical protein